MKSDMAFLVGGGAILAKIGSVFAKGGVSILFLQTKNCRVGFLTKTLAPPIACSTAALACSPPAAHVLAQLVQVVEIRGTF